MIAFSDALKPKSNFPMGALATLTYLDLESNQLGDEGMKAFSTALSSGALPSLADCIVNSSASDHELLQVCSARDIRLQFLARL